MELLKAEDLGRFVADHIDYLVQCILAELGGRSVHLLYQVLVSQNLLRDVSLFNCFINPSRKDIFVFVHELNIHPRNQLYLAILSPPDLKLLLFNIKVQDTTLLPLVSFLIIIISLRKCSADSIVISVPHDEVPIACESGKRVVLV